MKLVKVKNHNFQEGATGTHGTGFELIYYITNQFEIHWYNLEHKSESENLFSVEAIPKDLSKGTARWNFAKGVDDWPVIPYSNIM